MNGCAIQQNTFAARDEMRGPLVCPRPRRIGQLAVAPDPIRPLRWQSCQQVDPLDLKAGVEFLDYFLTKGEDHQMDPMPPFFCGSPPTRSANPVINDARFGEVVDLMPHLNPMLLASPVPVPVPVPVLAPAPAPETASSTSSRTGCAQTKFGFTPAAVRIEGFDCLDRDRNRRRGIQAVA